MPIPSVVNVYPRAAHTSGEVMVRILGDSFRVRPDPLYIGSPSITPTVRVLFGDVPAPYVAVANHALLFARAPAAALRPDGSGVGPVDVTVQNLDDAGNAIPGELGKLAGAFSYEALRLTARSTLVYVVAQLIRRLRAEVLQNVALGHGHTDYDATTGDTLHIVEQQELPSLVLVGPEIEMTREPDPPEVVETLGYPVRYRRSFLGNVRFTLLGSADRHVTLMNLQSATIAFFERNQSLQVDGRSYELGFDTGGSVDVTSASDENDITTFSGRVVIERVPVGGVPGFPDAPSGAIDISAPITTFSGWVYYQLRTGRE